MITIPALDALPTVAHGFFTREGGVSEGPYASRNCGLSVGDDPARVWENRARCAAELGVAADDLILVSQRHTAAAFRVEGAFPPDQTPVADALATTRPRLALAILTADCAPVLLADPAGGVIGAAHAGWRGALGGVLEATIALMCDAGARKERIIAGIGPCIAQRSYEVGAEFPRPFLKENEENQRFFIPSSHPGRRLFDLPGYAARKLERLGVGEIVAASCDTFAQKDRFFSHRRSVLRGESVCGRLLSAIVLMQ